MRFPKKLLIHEIDYLEFESEDRNHVPKFKSSVTIKNVRVDYIKRFEKTKQEELKGNECIIFCIGSHTQPFLPFKEKSKVIFNNDEMVIQKVIPISNPYTDELFGYELELI